MHVVLVLQKPFADSRRLGDRFPANGSAQAIVDQAWMQTLERLQHPPRILLRNGEVGIVRFGGALLGRHADADAQAKGRQDKERFHLQRTQRALGVIS